MRREEEINIPALSELHANRVSIQRDEILYNQNDSPDGFYLVRRGVIRLIHQINPENSYSTLIKQDGCFGIDEIVNPGFRLCTAIAEEDAILFRFSANLSQKNETESSAYIPVSLSKADLSSSKLPIQDLVRVEELNSAKIVHFCGSRGNLSNALKFKNYLFDLIEQKTNTLVIDLVACRLIDSTFLGTLIAALKNISSRNGRLILVCNSDVCSWLFYMTKMDKVFEVYTTLDDAIASISK